jgi:hypothetical protein
VYDRSMTALRPDQFIVSFYPTDGQWSAPVGVGVLPPTEEFVPGDLVHYYDRPDCVGLIVARTPREVEYDGLSAWTPENIRAAKERYANGGDSRILGKWVLDFYTVVWNTGTMRTAGAHQLHQLRRVLP